jgi:hypothetical protein
MRGPPQTPQTHLSFAPRPFGSTRAMAPQCGQRFPSPLVKPQTLQTPSTTELRPQAEQGEGGLVFTATPT